MTLSAYRKQSCALRQRAISFYRMQLRFDRYNPARLGCGWLSHQKEAK